ncbi:MAG: GNAT family N-acetyltransferase [Cyanobacteria bacterium P01_B01_bin.77]
MRFDGQIRFAQAADIEHLPAIERAAAQLYRPYLSQLGLTSDQLQDIVPVEFLHQAQQQRRLWVAVTPQTQVVGFVVVNRLTTGWFVIELDVLPSWKQQGIGSALMQQVIQSAHTQGYVAVTLTTFRYVPWTIPFYRRLGFEIVVPAHYTPDIRAIVDHEERHGFSRHVRVVMQCQIPKQLITPFVAN